MKNVFVGNGRYMSASRMEEIMFQIEFHRENIKAGHKHAKEVLRRLFSDVKGERLPDHNKAGFGGVFNVGKRKRAVVKDFANEKELW